MIRIALVSAAFALLSACAATPRVVGGPPLALEPALAASARIAKINVEASPGVAWRYAQMEGEAPSSDPSAAQDRFQWAAAWELQDGMRCAAGTRPLELRVRIDHIAYDDRLASLFDGKGQDVLAGVAELADPAQGGAIVGRYAIRAETGSGRLLTRIVTDRTDALMDAFGSALCREAFGR